MKGHSLIAGCVFSIILKLRDFVFESNVSRLDKI